MIRSRAGTGAMVGALSLAAAGAAAQTPTIADFDPLVARIEAAARTADAEAYMDLLAEGADRTAARAFAADALRRNVQEAAARGRFVRPFDDEAERTGYELTVEVFTERGVAGRLQTWTIDVVRDDDTRDGPRDWRIAGQERVDVVDGLLKPHAEPRPGVRRRQPRHRGRGHDPAHGAGQRLRRRDQRGRHHRDGAPRRRRPHFRTRARGRTGAGSVADRTRDPGGRSLGGVRSAEPGAVRGAGLGRRPARACGRPRRAGTRPRDLRRVRTLVVRARPGRSERQGLVADARRRRLHRRHADRPLRDADLRAVRESTGGRLTLRAGEPAHHRPLLVGAEARGAGPLLQRGRRGRLRRPRLPDRGVLSARRRGARVDAGAAPAARLLHHGPGPTGRARHRTEPDLADPAPRGGPRGAFGRLERAGPAAVLSLARPGQRRRQPAERRPARRRRVHGGNRVLRAARGPGARRELDGPAGVRTRLGRRARALRHRRAPLHLQQLDPLVSAGGHVGLRHRDDGPDGAGRLRRRRERRADRRQPTRLGDEPRRRRGDAAVPVRHASAGTLPFLPDQQVRAGRGRCGHGDAGRRPGDDGDGTAGRVLRQRATGRGVQRAHPGSGRPIL